MTNAPTVTEVTNAPTVTEVIVLEIPNTRLYDLMVAIDEMAEKVGASIIARQSHGHLVKNSAALTALASSEASRGR